MRPEFRYFRPKDLREALEALAEGGRPLAGGTDLVVDLKEGKARPELLVDISRLEELHFLETSNGLIRMGPLLTHREIASSELLRSEALPLALASAQVGSPQIRNVGTLGGNICNASPAADTLPALMVLEAELVLQGLGARRTIPFERFFVGPYKTVLQPDELLVEVRFRGLRGFKGGFWKVGRRRTFVQSRINLAVALRLEDGLVQEARISVGSSTPTPVRMEAAEEYLKGKPLEDTFLREAAHLATEAIASLSGRRPSASYKLPAISGLLWRALKEVAFGLSDR